MKTTSTGFAAHLLRAVLFLALACGAARAWPQRADSEEEIRRVEAEIAKRIADESIGRGYVTPSTRQKEYATYYEVFARRIECTGNRHYPEAARAQTFAVTVTVSVLADGKVEKVEIDRSSGNAAVDAAVRRLVQQAAPFAPFTPPMRAKYAVLDITSSWTFTRSNEKDERAEAC